MTTALQPGEFACIIDELEKLHTFDCDCDVTAYIYNTYLESLYESYTLFELIALFNINRTLIECPYNKREIIKTIVDKKLDIPYPKDYDNVHRTTWYVDSKCGLWIGSGLQQIKIKYNDVFRINKKDYKITCIKPLPYDKFKHKHEHIIILKNVNDTSQSLRMTVQEFINILDTKDVTIVKSMYIENIQELYKLWHNRFIKWGSPKLQSNIDEDIEDVPAFL